MPAIGKTSICAVLLLGWSVVATADPIVITRDGRRVSSQAFLESCSAPAAICTGFPPPAFATAERVQGDELIIAPVGECAGR
jgi:hypothetical protein